MRRLVVLAALSSALSVTPVLPAQPAAAVQQPSPGPAAQAPAATLPSAEQVFQRYRQAIGGAQALRRHRSRRVVGRFELAGQAIGGPLEILAAAPDKVVLRMELGGLGRVERGFDGTIGWSLDPAVGPRLLQGRELEELRDSAEFYSELKEPSQFASAAVVERTTFEGKDCYVVRVARRSGIEVTEYYEASSGLLAGSRMNSTSAMGSVPTTTVVDAYAKFDGIMMPTKVRQRALGVESVLTMTSVEHDQVPADAFAPPAAIAALRKDRE
jgi:hypothetical protein